MVTASVLACLSRRHIDAAIFFARSLHQLESENRDHIGPLPDSVRIPYTSFGIAAVIESVAALEACANEFFHGLSDACASRNLHKLPDHVSDVAPLISTLWAEFEGSLRISTLAKFDVAHSVVHGVKLPRGGEPTQSVQSLIRLRNALVHFRPEWDSNDSGDHAKLEIQLRGKFNVTPFRAGGDSFFPKSCFGFGCGEWAVLSVYAYVEAFYKSIGMPSRFAGLDVDMRRASK